MKTIKSRAIWLAAAVLILMVSCVSVSYAESTPLEGAPVQEDLTGTVLVPGVQDQPILIEGMQPDPTQPPDLPLLEPPVVPEATPIPMHRVTFYDFYGNVYAWADVPEGNFVFEPDRPVISGYDFQYWYDETNELSAPYLFGEPVVRDVNLWPMVTASSQQASDFPAPTNGAPEGMSQQDADALAQAILRTPAPSRIVPDGQQIQEILSTQAPAPGASDGATEPPSQVIQGTPEPGPEVSAAGDDLQGIIEEILATPSAETATPSPKPTSYEEGVIANIMDGAFLSPEETEQPIDSRAIIAEVVGGTQDASEEILVTSDEAPTTNAPPVEETKVPADQYTVDLIEAILSNPTKTEEPLDVPAETQAVPSAEPASLDEMATPPTAASEPTAAPDSTALGTTNEPEEPTPTTESTEEPVTTSEVEPTPAPQILGETPVPDAPVLATEPDDAEQPIVVEEQPVQDGGEPAVTITSVSKGEVTGIGSTVTLYSQVTGVPEGAMLVYQWQNDASGEYMDVPGATNSTYTYVVDEATNNCDWRLQVRVITK